MTAQPSDAAIRTPDRVLTYEELEKAKSVLSCRIAQRLSLSEEASQFGVPRVAVLMPKGWEQIVACLGVLAASCSYVPLELSDHRWEKVLEKAECSLVLIASCSDLKRRLKTYSFLEVTEKLLTEDVPSTSVPHTWRSEPGDTAYIIFTSGSTGEPKGVVISHESACNTCISINNLIHLTKDDNVSCHRDSECFLSSFSRGLFTYICH